MNWLDIIIVLLVLIPSYLGFRKGFMRKILGIIGIAAGFILAVKFYSSVAGILSSFIKESPVIVNVISFLLIVAIIYFLAVWLAKYMSDIGSGSQLINRLLGTAFGFIQGLLVASVLLYNFSFINFPSEETRNTSMLYSRVINIAPVVFDKIIDLFPGLKQEYNKYTGKEEKK